MAAQVLDICLINHIKTQVEEDIEEQVGGKPGPGRLRGAGGDLGLGIGPHEAGPGIRQVCPEAAGRGIVNPTGCGPWNPGGGDED